MTNPNMRTITIPNDVEVQVEGPSGDIVSVERIAFTQVLKRVWLNDARFSGSTEAGMHGLRILESFEFAPWIMHATGTAVRLHAIDWRVLVDAMTNPQPPNSPNTLSPDFWRRAQRAGWFAAVIDAPLASAE